MFEALGRLSWRAAAFLAAGLFSVLIVVNWLWDLYLTIPSVSRADFVLAMWHRARQLENGDIVGVIFRAFEPFGGHIVAYTRLLQLFNFVLFDYSVTFVRITALCTLALTWVAYFWVVLREFRATIAGAVMLLIGSWLICSPVIYGLTSWPDAIPPYYSAFIVLCFGLSPVMRRLTTNWTWPSFFLVVVFAFAVIIGSGIGWESYPAF